MVASRSGNNKVWEQNDKYEMRKVKETQDLFPKFTPQRSYVSVEEPTKGRVSSNSFPRSIDHKGLDWAFLHQSHTREGNTNFLGCSHELRHSQATSNRLGAKLQE